MKVGEAEPPTFAGREKMSREARPKFFLPTMQFKIFTIQPGANDALDDLNGFLRAHRVITVDRQFTGDGWAFCVCYEQNSTPGGGGNYGGKEKTDWMKVLPPEEFARFAELRKMRNRIAARTKLAAFIIFTDKEFEAIVKMKPPVTIEALKELKVLGRDKIEKYGGEVVETLVAHETNALAPVGVVKKEDENLPGHP